MRRLLATIALVLGLALGMLAAAPPAVAQGEGQTTTTVEPAPGGDIIPEPNSGVAPEDAGDRGGALQTALFVAIVVGIVGMAALVVRQSRRARAERGF